MEGWFFRLLSPTFLNVATNHLLPTFYMARNARWRFQREEGVKIIVMNFRIAGLDLSAAECVVYVQLPLYYTALYQSSDRAMGMNQVKLREEVKEIRLVAQYPTGAEEIVGERYQKYIPNGTPTEILNRNLKSGEKEFRWIMGMGGGVSGEEEAIAETGEKRRLIQAIHLGEVSQKESRLMEKIEEVTEGLGEWYAKLEDQEEIIDLARLLVESGVEMGSLLEAMEGDGELAEEWLHACVAMGKLRTKYLRNDLIHQTAGIIEAMNHAGKTIKELEREFGSWTEEFPEWVIAMASAAQVWKGIEACQGLKQIAQDITGLERGKKNEMQMRFGNALIGLIALDRSEVRDWLLRVGEILKSGGEETLTRRVEILEKVATIQQIGIQYLGLTRGEEYTNLEKLSKDVEETLEIAMGEESGVEKVSMSAIERIGGLWAPMQILATLKKEESKYQGDIQNFKRVLSEILKGNYESYRHQNQANQVPYKKDEERFWEIFNRTW